MKRNTPLSRHGETHHDAPGAPGFRPFRIVEVEIGRPLSQTITADTACDAPKRLLMLVRLHTRPLGLVEPRMDRDGLTAAGLARQIWDTLGAEINAHAREDGLPELTMLDADGLSDDGRPPRCLHERQALLAGAPRVAVIVATHDRTASLAACLRSLLALDYPDYEVIVVDNAPSTPRTAGFIHHTYSGSTRVRYVREDRPGLACAHNRGLEEVTAPIVAFTDDDVVVDRHWLAELIRGFSAGEHVACVTGMIFPRELRTPSQVWIERSIGLSKGFTRRVFDLTENRPRNPLYPYAAGMFGSGANMAFRTPALRAIGGFDPLLGAGSTARGGDDLAAFFDVVTAGYTLVYEPAALVYHEHRREYGGLRAQMYGYGVGLTAFLTRSLVERPGRLPDVAGRIPHGLAYAFGARSPKNARRPADYPRELTSIERRGMLHGPFAYMRGRLQSHRATKSPDPALTSMSRAEGLSES